MFDWLNKKNSKQEQPPVVDTVNEPIMAKSIEEIKLEMYLGKLVICVSNEIDNVIVAYGKEIYHITQQKIPMLVVYDLVDKKEIMPLCKVFDYTEQRFNALNKLDANERISILYESSFGDETVDKKLREGRIIYPSDVWAEKVNAAIAEWKQGKEIKAVKKMKP